MKILLLLTFIFICNCYSNPRNKLQANNKSKPLFIKQYEERNRKEKLIKRKPNLKKEVLPMKEVKIKFTKEKFNYGNKSNKTK